MGNNITANRIKELRKKLGITQGELAEKLNVQRQIISYYETGSRTPNIDDIIILANAFNTSADYLLGLSDTPTTDKDISFICDYIGLSEESVNALNIYKSKDTCYNFVLDFLLQDKETLSFLCRFFLCDYNRKAFSRLMEYEIPCKSSNMELDIDSDLLFAKIIKDLSLSEKRFIKFTKDSISENIIEKIISKLVSIKHCYENIQNYEDHGLNVQERIPELKEEEDQELKYKQNRINIIYKAVEVYEAQQKQQDGDTNGNS